MGQAISSIYLSGLSSLGLSITEMPGWEIRIEMALLRLQYIFQQMRRNDYVYEMERRRNEECRIFLSFDRGKKKGKSDDSFPAEREKGSI